MAVGRIKVQQQIDGKTFWQTLQKVASTRTLYAGYTMTLVFESSRGLYMVAYSVLKQSLAHHLQTDAEAHSPSMGVSLPLWARTAAGAGANVLCWSIMYPVDVIRSVQMSRSTSDAHAKSGFGGAIDCARGLIREGGVARLYRGFLATMLRAGPVAGIILPCFELVLPWLEGRRGDGLTDERHQAAVTPPARTWQHEQQRQLIHPMRAAGAGSVQVVTTDAASAAHNAALVRRASGPM